MIQIYIAVTGAAAAALCDWKTRKIPNALTLSMIVLGLILGYWSEGLPGLKQSFFGLIVGILFLYFPFAWGGVGGGDVKLVGAVGSLLGPALVFQIFLASAVFGGIFSVAAMIKGKAFRKTLRNIKDKALFFFLTRKVLPEVEGAQNDKRLKIPYACAIGCGTLFVLFVL
ncbi:MAG: hypothetical protein A3G87_01890 [Omnitrophica bacterium RIFCSPLOWO2_12_FULL_50_11]|nr:MAG: hypothetical protein A3G87_01890 [Omnitrophica bacterium RIFCSPLOWO2_12_FULL_50_11]